MDTTSCKIWDIINCPHGLMGSVGYLRDSQLISSYPVVNPDRILTKTVDFDYVVCELYEHICSILESHHRMCFDPQYNENGLFIPPMINNEFIFAYEDMAYEISQDGCVRPIEDYLVIGSGSDVATGVLDNNYDKSAEERIVEAILTCNRNTLYIDNNVTLLYTYEVDCENTDCNSCERKDYCGYYLDGEYKEDEDTKDEDKEHLLDEEKEYKEEQLKEYEPVEENHDKTKKKKVKEEQKNDNAVISGRLSKRYGKYSRPIYRPHSL